ncbi:patatin-like phospholipase domain-containing protein [Crepidotus variabilis]|uniref:Patatin-like phospholipase domain-containing protein n=1 Tax=Crepidotus variabilis TaxID=179855 RepID=A0A9P6EST7_9AGAR|nr:patatin-like phospholipase domain-containing protein [Crepidotus variabilis]
MPGRSRKPEELSSEVLLSQNFINNSHIQAFAHALRLDEAFFDNHAGYASSPPVPGTPGSSHSNRIRKVSALSDFAPVNVKVTRRKRRLKHDKRNDYLFILLRWPLLCFIFLFIMAEFGLYVFIRQLVNTKEWFTAWRGEKGRLRKRLRGAKTYEEWKDAATTLDRFLQFEEWKKVDEDPFYDWMLVRKVKRSLKALREKEDVRGCLGVLETCIRANFAAVESSRLYSETFLGTKDLIESYNDELERSLEFIRNTPELTIDEKRRFFKSANTNLGISALCLSGGASFGYYHVGVVKAFLDAGLLPRVITGTSAGGLVAALACTRTDEELKRMLIPELARNITACEEPLSVWFKRFWTTGARFDSVEWAKKCTFFTRGSMTFREAYLRTGRILNISVIPADQHSPTKLLNYMTAPDTVIWSALLASAAVPGILNPVVLMQKLKDGNIVPWSWGSRFKDGSLRVDIPVQALNLYFNVTHPVVSQVNPHVHLFFFAPRGSAGKPVAHRKGKGWRGNFLLSAAEQWLKHELTKNFKVIRDLELLPQLLGQDWSSVFLQRFDGAVTIWPKTRFWDWIRILTDPDEKELERMIWVGQSVTWPKLHMIENRTRIEKQILLGRQAVRRSAQNKSRTSSRSASHEPRPMLQKITNDPTKLTPALMTLSPPASDFEHPLSVDTDAEAAFARNSRFFKRGRSSKNVSPHRLEDRDVPGISRRHSRLVELKPSAELEEHQQNGKRPATVPSSPRIPKQEPPQSAGFFSRFRANSLSKFSVGPFSYDHAASSRKERDATPPPEYTWSSESSSEEDFPWGDRVNISNGSPGSPIFDI